MKDKVEQHILFLTPSSTILEEPLIDIYTMKMAAALRACEQIRLSRKSFVCECGAYSPADILILDGLQISAMAVHFLAYHRREVPDDALAFIMNLPYEPVEPNDGELRDPKDFAADF